MYPAARVSLLDVLVSDDGLQNGLRLRKGCVFKLRLVEAQVSPHANALQQCIEAFKRLFAMRAALAALHPSLACVRGRQ